jgi:hypothetical protein
MKNALLKNHIDRYLGWPIRKSRKAKGRAAGPVGVLPTLVGHHLADDRA